MLIKNALNPEIQSVRLNGFCYKIKMVEPSLTEKSGRREEKPDSNTKCKIKARLTR